MTLDELGFPNISLEQNGILTDLETGKCRKIFPNGKGLIRLSYKHKRKLLHMGWLWRFCFLAPWRDPKLKCKSLKYLGFSRYIAVSDGRIFGTRNMNYRVPQVNVDGYHAITLWDDQNQIVPWRVCRLIALAFVPNPDGKDTVNHIDGNKRNDDYRNLEWVTAHENYNHARKTGLTVGLTDEQIHEICKRLERGQRIYQIAKEMGIKTHSIRGIMYGSYYHISKDYNIPRYEDQKRLPVKYRKKKISLHGQTTRKHKLPLLALPQYANSSTTKLQSTDTIVKRTPSGSVTVIPHDE